MLKHYPFQQKLRYSLSKFSIIEYFYYKLLKIRYKNNNKKITFGKNVKIDNHCAFGGYNTLMNNTSFFSSNIGFASYVANNTVIKKTKIGKFCSIGDYVRTCLGVHPSSGFVSTSPSFYSLKSPTHLSYANEQYFEEHSYIDDEKKYVVEIGNDVWIGNNVSIIDGVKIGDGAILAIGAVVTKDVEPYTIVGGVPAKPIKKRFTDEQIKFLLRFKWWDKDKNYFKDNNNIFHSIKEFINFNKI
jgi:acetyltransferase-like isoleucine patch superfamily enzyme